MKPKWLKHHKNWKAQEVSFIFVPIFICFLVDNFAATIFFEHFRTFFVNIFFPIFCNNFYVNYSMHFHLFFSNNNCNRRFFIASIFSLYLINLFFFCNRNINDIHYWFIFFLFRWRRIRTRIQQTSAHFSSLKTVSEK